MAKLLYIEASPRKTRSKSIDVAKTFLEALRSEHPSLEIDKLDLWTTELPRFDGSVLDAKYAVIHGQQHTAEEAQAWRQVENVITRFKAPDWYLFSLPMWNFGLPYVLKHYIDVIVQPGLTFSFNPDEGYSGLVQGKKAAAVYARGGAYGPGSGAEGYDLQSRALAGILGFVGVTDLTSIFIEPTIAEPAQVEATVAKAKERAAAVAREWAVSPAKIT
jgi:FMN-dependent NADH-azoreductase